MIKNITHKILFFGINAFHKKESSKSHHLFVINPAMKFIFLCMIVFSHVNLFANTWQIDTKESSIRFAAKSRFVNTDGIFKKWYWKGKADSLALVSGTVTVDIASIDTKNTKRDKHLRNPDFFDIKKFPKSTFVITNIIEKKTTYIVEGKLTIKSISKKIKILFDKVHVETNKINLKASFPLSLKNYAITFNSSLNPIDDIVVIIINLVVRKK